MAKEFRLPDPGEGIHEAEILEVHVSEGDEIDEDDTLLTIETDKASMEIPSPASGVVEEIRVEEGQVVDVGDVVLTFRAEDAGQTSEEEPAQSAAEGESSGKDRAGEQAQEAAEEPSGEETQPAEEVPSGEEAQPTGGDDGRPVPASPATRRLARELEVDLRSVEASGPEGRVTAEDVRAAAGEAEEEEEAEGTVEAGDGTKAESRDRRRAAGLGAGHEGALSLPDFTRWGEVERVSLRSVRRTTARRMTEAWRRVPHVTHWDVADVTELEAFREDHREEVERKGGDLTLTPLIVKAAVAALKAWPRFNASLDESEEQLVLKRYYHVGIAVATDRGLLVPVVRDADRKSIVELAVEVSTLSERARGGDLERDEMQGGSFTITNPGPLGGTTFSPIVNWPEVAILGVAQARWEPAVVAEGDDRRIEPRLHLPLGLAFDHRVVDGADAARFVNTVIETLSDPESLLLEA